VTGARALRLLSWTEGLSLLGLLLIAMPLKYAFGLPLAVRIAGSIHGLLFLALLSVGAQVALERTLPKQRVLRVVGWSLLPFGFLLADRDLKGA